MLCVDIVCMCIVYVYFFISVDIYIMCYIQDRFPAKDEISETTVRNCSVLFPTLTVTISYKIFTFTSKFLSIPLKNILTIFR